MELLNKAYKFFWSIVETNDKKRMDKQTLPEGINAIVDIPYADDGKNEHLLDVYFPEGAEDKKLPVIIDIHGGGLMYAYKELNKNYCYHLAGRGFTVINVSYSLCPENPFPAGLVDVMNALKYIGDNLESYPCDRDRVYITGDSAGGLLAAYAALIVSSEELQRVYNVGKVNLDIKAAGLTSGMFFFDSGLAKVLSPGIFGKGGRKKSPYKDYLAFCDIIDKGTFPPTYLVTSKEDMIHKATLMFKELLDDRGVENEMDDWQKVEGHKLEHVFSVLYPSEYPESVATIDHMTKFFLSH
ncbi:MAG: alpha/beta hydrolase [Christensenellales bacterium]